MSYTVSTLHDGRLVILTMPTDFRVEKELLPALREISTLLDATPDKKVMMVDSRSMNFANLEEVLFTGKATTTPESNDVMRNPHLLKAVTVTSNKVVQLVVKGLSNVKFGSLEFTIFDNMDEALAYVAKELGIPASEQQSASPSESMNR